MASEWGDKAVAMLRQLWASGRTASEIAAEIGCTRNAVIGKAHRLKLEQRKPTPERGRKKPQPRPRRYAIPKPKPEPRPIRVKRGKSLVFVARPIEMTKGEMRAFLKMAVLNTVAMGA